MSTPTFMPSSKQSPSVPHIRRLEVTCACEFRSRLHSKLEVGLSFEVVSFQSWLEQGSRCEFLSFEVGLSF